MKYLIAIVTIVLFAFLFRFLGILYLVFKLKKIEHKKESGGNESSNGDD